VARATANPMKDKGESNKRGRGGFELWKERQRRKGLDWKEVDPICLKAAFATAVAEDVAIMISGASGGTGVCVTVWVDGTRHKEYANNAEELMELLDAITDQYSSSAEDIRATVRGVTIVPGSPADQ